MKFGNKVKCIIAAMLTVLAAVSVAAPAVVYAQEAELTAEEEFLLEAQSEEPAFTEEIDPYAEAAAAAATDIPENFGVKTVDSTSVTLAWNTVSGSSGYVILELDQNGNKTKTAATLSGGTLKNYTIKNLIPDTTYYYAIQSYTKNYKGTVYGPASTAIAVRTETTAAVRNEISEKLSNGFVAAVVAKAATLNGNINTTYNSERLSYIPNEENGGLTLVTHGDYASVCELTHFFDCNGYYTIVYEDTTGEYLNFDRYTEDLSFVSSIQIKKQYPLYGDVVTDKNGYYYIIWGQEDRNWEGKITTFASKYSYDGKHIKTTSFKRFNVDYDCAVPFYAGNCDTAISKDGILVSNYGKLMQSGHQANELLCVDTETMEQVIISNYASHSFDQRVISLNDGGIGVVNKGDSYPRAFDVEFYSSSKKGGETFHFYGNNGDNYIYASLGNIVESGGNVYLVGSSAKSLTANAKTESQNIFIQAVGTGRSIEGAESRSGTSCGQSVTDKNFKWLTNCAEDETVINPQAVSTDDGRIVILWEVHKKTGLMDTFADSYYMILSSDGTVLQEATSLNKIRLTAYEDPVYRSGHIYWTTAGYVDYAMVPSVNGGSTYALTVVDGDKGMIHKLNVGKLQSPIPLSQTTVTGIVNKPYTGYKVTQEFTVMNGSELLVEGRDYTVSYENNINVGTATVTITGLGRYTGTITRTFEVTTDISKTFVSTVRSEIYTGFPITPKPTLTYFDETLVEGKDYTLSYRNNIDAGTATVIFTGTGRFSGQKEKTFVIQKAAFSKDNISGIQNTEYTGKPVVHPVKVTYNGKTLQEGKDYTISYETNVNAGNAVVVVTGIGNFNCLTRCNFRITPKKISTEITGIENKAYTGSAVTQKLTIKDGSKTLIEGTDYSVTYKNNVNIGTATATITGKGNYTGTVEKTFTISARKLDASISGIENKVYTGSALTQNPIVKNGSKRLVEGTDYTVSYKNNVNVGTATVIITGQGNYTGSMNKTFTISAKNMSSLTISGIKDVGCIPTAVKQKIAVTDGSKTLKEGTDYTVSYKNHAKPGKATVAITGKGNYTGTVTKNFTIANHTYDNNVDGKCNSCGVNRENVEVRQVTHMFRMYNPNTGEHFYTGSEVEKGNLVAAGWHYEGVGFTFPANTGAPVHRLFQQSTGEHLYTMDENEKSKLMKQGWNYEGIAFNSAYNTEAVQYRLHNPNAKVGAYHFTFSQEERQNLLKAGWEDQGIGWYSCWK